MTSRRALGLITIGVVAGAAACGGSRPARSDTASGSVAGDADTTAMIRGMIAGVSATNLVITADTGNVSGQAAVTGASLRSPTRDAG